LAKEVEKMTSIATKTTFADYNPPAPASTYSGSELFTPQQLPEPPREDIFLTPLAGSPNLGPTLLPSSRTNRREGTLSLSPVPPHIGYETHASSPTLYCGETPAFAQRTDIRLQGVPELSADVATHLQSTVEWQMDAATLDRSVDVHPISRQVYCNELLKHDQNLGAFRAFFLSRVQGVTYSTTLKKVVVVHEVTRSWHPDYFKHEMAKAMTQRALELNLGKQASKDDLDPLVFVHHLNDLHTAPKRYHKLMVLWSSFHALHAESVADAVAPTRKKAPWRQRIWAPLLWLFAPQHMRVRRTVARHRTTFANLQGQPNSAPLINGIYRHGGLAEVLLGQGVASIYSVPGWEKNTVSDAAATLRLMNPSGVARVRIFAPLSSVYVP
jgi:hypothetical protein